ncbi:MAG: FliH/SctL family protein [Firmicutes bacterium]|nr:FliH/SctL family protein [Bacillota bacterium]
MKLWSPVAERVRYLSNVIKTYEWRRAEPYQLSLYPSERLLEEIQVELEARRREEEEAALAAQQAVEEGQEEQQAPPDIAADLPAPTNEPSEEPTSTVLQDLASLAPDVTGVPQNLTNPPEEQVEKLLETAAQKAKDLEAEAQKAAESLKAEAQAALAQAEEGRRQAEAQLAGSRREAAALVEGARGQAADMVEKAQKEAETILEEARERGYQEGLAQGREAGHREGHEAGIKETSGLAAQARTVLETALAEREQLIRGASQDILKLVVKIAEKIIRGQLRLDPAIIQRTVEDAVKLVNDKARVVIRVNPSELETARSGEVKIRQFLEGSTQLEIVGDETIEPGGCMIETNSGSVDARIATQLEETAHLLEGLGHGG